jgi:hypothetical protein
MTKSEHRALIKSHFLIHHLNHYLIWAGWPDKNRFVLYFGRRFFKKTHLVTLDLCVERWKNYSLCFLAHNSFPKRFFSIGFLLLISFFWSSGWCVCFRQESIETCINNVTKFAQKKWTCKAPRIKTLNFNYTSEFELSWEREIERKRESMNGGWVGGS